MKIIENDEYNLIFVEDLSLGPLESVLLKINTNHLLIELSENIIIVEEKISFFLKAASNLKAKGKSFVIIQKRINIDDFPEVLNITPTLQEAKDILEMEAIERDLGF
jgi:restriction endonuclease S subunit